MDIEQAVLENLRSLPSESQSEVLTFIKLLRKRLIPSSPSHPTAFEQIVETVLLNLQRIQRFHDGLPSAVYAYGLLEATQNILVRFPDEPLAKFLDVLHKVLATDNRWGRYTVEYYQQIYSLLNQLAHQGSTSDAAIEAAIQQMEQTSLTLLQSGIVTDEDLDDTDEYA
ncbi:hypothetical protein ACQ4M3_32915 [Leptolyngbya sp. AN03gr2]|uniref:hypothetical protein n=1 Tax=unclassified Leptolyngbya TaxID=2650499 RepID=UPI003D316A8A